MLLVVFTRSALLMQKENLQQAFFMGGGGVVWVFCGLGFFVCWCPSDHHDLEARPCDLIASQGFLSPHLHFVALRLGAVGCSQQVFTPLAILAFFELFLLGEISKYPLPYSSLKLSVQSHEPTSHLL